MENEMRALKKNGTWDVVDLPMDKEPDGCKWVFTIKLKANESVDRYLDIQSRLSRDIRTSGQDEYHSSLASFSCESRLVILTT